MADIEKTDNNTPAPVSDGYVRQCLAANELGDAYLFATLHQGRVLYDASSGQWLIWAGHHWQPDLHGRALLLVEDVALAYLSIRPTGDDEAEGLRKAIDRRIDRLRTRRGRENTLSIARTVQATDGTPALSVSGDQLDARPGLLGVANGVIDLHNGNLRNGQPDDYITVTAGTSYPGLGHTPERFLEFLEQVQPDPEIQYYLQKLFGYCLLGRVDHHVIHVFLGRAGRNGKSTLLEILRRVLGDTLAGTIPASLLMCKPYQRSSAAPSPDILSLRGRRIVYSSEVEAGQRFSAASCKMLSGGYTLTGRAPYAPRDVQFQPSHHLFLATNHEPRAQGDDAALWSRLCVIPFHRVAVTGREPIPEAGEFRADPQLMEKLDAERPQILSWLVEGALLYQRDGHLDPPQAITAATDEYRRQEDVLGQWLQERCDDSGGGRTQVAALHADFSAWLQRTNNGRPWSNKAFSSAMNQRYTRVRDNRGKYYPVLLRPA